MTINERSARRALIIIAFAALTVGLAAAFTGRGELAQWVWAAGTIPVAAGLAVSIVRDVLAGRISIDTVAFVSMAAALGLGQTLAGVVVAIMYAGGAVLEDFAAGRADAAEAIGAAVILNALRALSPGWTRRRASMPVAIAQDHRRVHIRPSPPTFEHATAHEVVIRVPNPDLLLAPGMAAAIRIVIDRRGHYSQSPRNRW